MPHRTFTAPSGLKGRRFLLALFTILLGIALTVLDTTTITLGLPTMTRELGVRADQAIWIVNGFQLAGLVALLPLAQWGERISYRRVYLLGVALWGMASALAAMAESLPLLIVARVVQGLGAAGVMAVNMALVRLTWPPALLGRGVALNSMVVSTATVLGPLVAAAVLSVMSWRGLLALNVPACVLLLALGYRALPDNPPATPAPTPSLVDILLNSGLFILLFMAADRMGRAIQSPDGRIEGIAQGVVLLTLGALVGVVHVRRQWHRPHALLPVDLLRIPVFGLSVLTSVGSFAAQTMSYIVLPFLLLDVWRSTPSQAGLFMAWWPVGTIASAALAARWIGRTHGGRLGAVGLGLQALGLASLGGLALTQGQAMVLALGLAVCGVGFGLFQSPNNHLMITSAPGHRAGAASGMVGSARMTGQTLGATLVAIVFAVEGETSAQGMGMALFLAALLSGLAAGASLLRVRYPHGKAN
jgi:MFS transporter, DHA2 family, multidrug resistance protein